MRVIVPLLLLAAAVGLAVETRALGLTPPGPLVVRQRAPSELAPRAVVERPDFGAAFAADSAVGTFVLLDLAEDTLHVYAPDRAAQRFLPASTFKIPHALIALETGAVADTTEVFAWDGVERFAPAWNRNQMLGTALRASVVWVFQNIARRIGPERMRAHLARLGYGNADIGGGLDRFWLDGALRVSALEQIAFLEGLARGALPLSSKAQDDVRAMLRVERGTLPDSPPDADGGTPYALYAKTGWTTAPEPDLGWWVGWVEAGGRVYVFALNLDMPRGGGDAPKRIRVARRILAAEGLLPAR